jgi:tetratricopeptide (TPR) repeat protein
MTLTLVTLWLLGANGSAGGWQELKSPQFTLRTNLDKDDALRAAVEIEWTLAALQAAMWPPVQQLGIEPVDIIVLKDNRDFEHYADGARGLYSHSVPPRIVLWGTPDRWEERLNPLFNLTTPGRALRADPATMDFDLRAHLDMAKAGSSSVLRHELAHHVASAVYGRVPMWFSEGQAQFLESLKLSEDGRTATIGLMNPNAWREFRNVRTIDTLDVLRWDTPSNELSQGASMGLYGASWQLYQWLFTTHQAALRCFQERLAVNEEAPAAWARCFPDLAPHVLDKDLWEFARRGSPSVVQVPVAPLGLDVKIRPLSESEVHLVRAQVALAAVHPADFLAEAETEVQRALATDPASVGALQLLAPTVPPKVRLENGRRAVAAHPDDGWAWLLLADALWDAEGPPGERYLAYHRATELLPNSPLVLARAARNLLSRDQRLEALVLAQRAAHLAPGNGEVLTIEALALAAAGRCADGMSVANQARKVLAPENGRFALVLDMGLHRACPSDFPADGGAAGPR